MNITTYPNSSNIAAIISSLAISGIKGEPTLVVIFNNKAAYAYHDVPLHIIEQLHTTTASIGTVFNQLIKNTGYTYERLI